MMSGAKYLIICLSLTTVIIAVVGAINYAVDPCGIYHYGKSWDWIDNRPQIAETIYLHKSSAVADANADVLFLGSSRTDNGLNPHNPILPGRAYNLGLYGGGLYEAWRYLQHACAAHTPSTVVLGVDATMFSPALESRHLFEEDQLLVRADGSPTPVWSHFLLGLPALFSLSTLDMSARTLLASKDYKITFESGFQSDQSGQHDHRHLTKTVLGLNKTWTATGGPLQSYRTPDGRTPLMDDLHKIITLCANKHIHLIVFIYPLHASVIDMQTGNWEVYGEWLKAVAAQMESTPELKGEFWDFTGYTSISTEPFPLPTEPNNHMRYYWEMSHFRPNVGDMVLQRIFAGTGPKNFGRRVTAATADQDLERLQAEKEAWHSHGQAVPIQIERP